MIILAFSVFILIVFFGASWQARSINVLSTSLAIHKVGSTCCTSLCTTTPTDQNPSSSCPIFLSPPLSCTTTSESPSHYPECQRATHASFPPSPPTIQ